MKSKVIFSVIVPLFLCACQPVHSPLQPDIHVSPGSHGGVGKTVITVTSLKGDSK